MQPKLLNVSTLSYPNTFYGVTYFTNDFTIKISIAFTNTLKFVYSGTLLNAYIVILFIC